MSKRLLENDQLLAPGKEKPTWQVIDPKPRNGCIKLFDYEKNLDRYVELSTVNSAIVDGSLVLRRLGQPAVCAAAQNDPELGQIIGAAKAHVRTVQQIQKKYGVSLAKAYARAKHDAINGPGVDVSFPSRATIYRYVRNTIRDLPILRGAKNKGNRQPRYGKQIIELVQSLAKELYLFEASTYTLFKLQTHINDEARDLGLLGFKQSISQQFVSKIIRETLCVDPEIARMNPRLVRAEKSLAKNRIAIARPFDRVEQDALHLPFVVKTPHGTTDNIYLIHAIECCMSIPLGWYFVIGAPRESDGLKCVGSILFSKKDALAQLGLSYDLDIYGTPHQLIFDNGPEAKGDRIKNLTKLDIDVMHCKARDAAGKPFIERLNKSLKVALETLPGCTRKDGQDGQRDPVALGDKLMTLDELKIWVVSWYFESWINNPLERHRRIDLFKEEKLGNTPAKRWKTMTQDLSYAMPLSPPLAQWLRVQFEYGEGTLSRKTGMPCAGLYYRGNNIEYLIGKYGETTQSYFKDPDDFRVIFFDDGDNHRLVELIEEYVDETTPAYSFSEIKEMRLEEKAKETESPIKLSHRRKVQNASVKAGPTPTKNKQSRTERNRAVADAARNADAIRRALDKPVDPRLFNGPGAGDDSEPGGFTFDDVEPLPIFNRKDGLKKP